MDYIVYVDSNNRDQILYPNSNSYTLHLTTPIRNVTKVEVLSAMLPNVFSSQYLTLDINELRTPQNLIADALNLTDTYPTNEGNTSAIHNLSVPTANAFYGSFATIPVKASASISSNLATFTNTNFIYNTEFYNANYRIVREFPSRIDSIDRLTITWRQPNNGNIFIDNNFSPPIDLGRNMFILRFQTVFVPDEPERLLNLPAPVEWDSKRDQKMQMMIVAGVALLGLLIIISVKVR